MKWQNYVVTETKTKEGSYLMLLDTELEKSIGLGTTYPFPPQKEAECLVS
jgi:hypothetical protein